MALSFICNNINDTDILAEKFARAVKNTGAFVCLFGDIGAGKTAFIKLVCKYLNVKEKVTSPSFVILNEYKSGELPIYHFDLYRLEKEGIATIVNELEEYSEGNILTFVEWAEFSQDAVPFDRINLRINYIDINKREFVFTSSGSKSQTILKRLEI
ncbi:MAG: tRNA (adenosine(37)-N6)-threonylcarbamoyltransferase complex ATPase subunit type 1 TsaE [Candidatus Gastranaerophilales bacterium]|nr:tRNA (adenosine(37)-N6)-threonylcarbamoyltransferase complex ATPase subunit type 1 TsaE [Candidatus Gastranaerophilales bacterium]